MSTSLTCALFVTGACLALNAIVSAQPVNPGPTATFTFDSSSIPAAAKPDGIAALDVDGDGDLDLAVALDNPDRVLLLINSGGSFAPGNQILLPDAGVGSLAAADFDNDGLVDLAVAMHNGNFIQLLRQTRGSFFSMGTIPTGANPRGLVAGDADGDGKADLAVANRDADTATFARNLGGFSFATQTLTVGGDPRAATFAASGATMRLAVTNHGDRSISVFSWSGTSYVALATLSLGNQVRPEGIDAADLNGDNVDDLVAAANGDTPALNRISVFLANGSGFGPAIAYVTDGIETTHVTLADFDCDGDVDVATTNEVSGNVSALANSGAGVFGPALLFAAGTTPETIIAADFDGDTAMDIAVGNRDSNEVTTMLNTTCAAPVSPADLNGDGAVDGKDLGILLGAWGTAGADLNGDGTTDAADLAMLLGAWS